MSREAFHRSNSVPAIVHIVITQATRRRAEGTITPAIFERQIHRIKREELEPKDLALLVRDLPGGRTRFLIKEKSTGSVCEIMDFAPDGTPEPGSSSRKARS
jgi:hypothetical protein